MPVLWSDLQSQTQDYIRTYTTGNISQGNLDRGINRAIEYFQRRLSLPSDRRIYRFYFSQDTIYYTLPTGFNEAIGLFYDNQANNVPANSWGFRPDIDIMAISGLGGITDMSAPFLNNRFWGFTTVNQLLQVAMLGSNLFQPATIDPLTAIGSWVASGDASGLAVDTNIWKVGSASLSFSATYSTGAATLTSAPSGFTYNILNQVQNNGSFKFWVWFGSTTGVTNIQLKLQSSSGNLYTGIITTQDDGTAWTSNAWNKVSVSANNFTTTGSPVSTAINNIKIVFNVTASLTAATTFRVNDLFTTIPDYMDLVYYSSYKGYVNGSSPKTDINVFNYQNTTTNNNDILYFGDYAPDLIGPIAKRAAVELMPQLRQDKDFYMEYKKEIEDWIHQFGKIYPRVRTMNFGRTKLERSTP